MFMLLAVIELLQSLSKYFVHWVRSEHRPCYASKRVAPIDKHNHYYSQHKPEWIKQEIIRLKACMPKAGCRSIADLCNRRFAASRKVTVGKTFVHETLQRHAYEVQILRRNLKNAKSKDVPRNLIWGIDLAGKTDTHGKLHSIFGIIDHGSRALLYLQALHDKTSRTLITCIVEAININGKPRLIRTDNEAIFTSKTFRIGLKRLGIRHQYTTPGCPWQNGRIERLFGTLKEKLDCWVISGIEQLNRDLGTFQYWYNQIRPHQNLQGRTPAEARCGINPYVKPPEQKQWFEAWDGLLTGYHLRY